jgi:hypothetical protein
MARVFKPTYPKPLPADAKIVEHDGRLHARFKDRRGQTVLAPLTEDGQKVLLETRMWYVEYRDANGVLRKVPGFTDRKATDQLAADLEKKAAREIVGLSDPRAEEHIRRPLPEHLTDFRTALEAKGNSPAYVRLVLGRLEAVTAACGWLTVKDVDAEQANE